MDKKRFTLAAITVELLIVIFGISIAFWLNNWNEARKQRAVEISLMQDMLGEMHNDSLAFNYQIGQLKTINDRLEGFLELCRNKDYTNDSIESYINSFLDRSNWLISSQTYQTLVDGGKLDLLSDMNYRKAVTSFYTLRGLQNRKIFSIIQEFLDDKMYPYLYVNSDLFVGTDNPDFSFIRDREFQNLLGMWSILNQEKGYVYAQTLDGLTGLINFSDSLLIEFNAASRN